MSTLVSPITTTLTGASNGMVTIWYGARPYPDDGTAGVREPRHPSPSQPPVAAQRSPL